MNARHYHEVDALLQSLSSKAEPICRPKGREADGGRENHIVTWRQAAAGNIDQGRDDERSKAAKNRDGQ
jgi:hypothetical protein